MTALLNVLFFLYAGNIPTEPYQVPKTAGRVKVDGVLDEALWDSALKLEVKYEVNPGENIPAPVKTEAFITYNDNYFLVAFFCHDPNPAAILARYKDQDQIFDDDFIGIAIDTFNDQKRAYEMTCNPLGVQADAINDGITYNYDLSWNAIWDSAGRITDKGYIIEIAIPFNQIRFQKTDGKQIWGFDIFRRYPREVHHHIGMFPRDRDNPNYLSQTLKLEGFEGIKPGKNIQLTPTLTYSKAEIREPDPTQPFQTIQDEAEAGISGRWSLNSSLTLNMAVNPDFSQVEADSVQLTINEPFALFFNETRPFFKEGADYFSTPISLLHTRSIADPSVAIKVTGKTGAHTYGVFTAQDEVTNLIVPGSFGSKSGSFDMENTSSAGRYRYDFGKNSTAGVMFTSREGDHYYNRVLSGDMNYRFNKNDDLILHLVGSETEYSSDIANKMGLGQEKLSDPAFYAEFRHRKRSYGVWAAYQYMGDEFRSDLGFNPMVGFNQALVGSEYKWYFDSKNAITEFGFGGDWDKTQETNGAPIEEEYEIWAWIAGKHRSNFNIDLLTRTRTFAGRDYDQENWSHHGEMSPLPFINFRYNIRGGDWIDFAHERPATFFSHDEQANIFFGRHLTLQAIYSYYEMEVEGGWLYKTKVQEYWLNYHFDRRFRVRAIFQIPKIERNKPMYSFEVQAHEKEISSQILASYKVNPQTVAYLGYSDHYVQSDQLDQLKTGRQIFAKLSYAWLN